jgi:hypothetical protein
MGMALAAEADDRDFLAFDQVHIGIAIVIDTHGNSSPVPNSGGSATALFRYARHARA